MLGAVAALAVTIGLVLVCLPLLRRLQAAAGTRGRGVPLEILQRVATGPRQGVVLLRCADRVLVLSVAESGARMLTELEGEARAEALAQAEQPAAPGRVEPGSRYRPALGRWAKLAGLSLPLALLVMPLSAQAQTPVPVQTPTQVQAPAPVRAQAPTVAGPSVTPPAPPKIDFRIGSGGDEMRLSGTVGLVVFMGAMTLLPAIVLLMTSFTRILIVLHFLRSALGTQTTPPGQLLVAVAVLLTGVVMNPVLQRVNTDALQPYFDGRLSQVEAYHQGVQPLREFMLANTRDQDLASFAEMSGAEDVASLEELPTVTITSAFVTSELRTAFQMGFVIFLPFIVVDLIVASVLMSMGMFMLPPVMISLPFKLLLFVLADGWTLVVRNLVASFRV